MSPKLNDIKDSMRRVFNTRFISRLSQFKVAYYVTKSYTITDVKLYHDLVHCPLFEALQRYVFNGEVRITRQQALDFVCGLTEEEVKEFSLFLFSELCDWIFPNHKHPIFCRNPTRRAIFEKNWGINPRLYADKKLHTINTLIAFHYWDDEDGDFTNINCYQRGDAFHISDDYMVKDIDITPRTLGDVFDVANVFKYFGTLNNWNKWGEMYKIKNDDGKNRTDKSSRNAVFCILREHPEFKVVDVPIRIRIEVYDEDGDSYWTDRLLSNRTRKAATLEEIVEMFKYASNFYRPPFIERIKASKKRKRSE